MMLTVNLSRIGLPDPQHARCRIGLEPITLGVGQPSFAKLTAPFRKI